MFEYLLWALCLWSLGGAITVGLYIRNVLRDTVDQYPSFTSWGKVFLFWPLPMFCWFIIRSVEKVNEFEEKNK